MRHIKLLFISIIGLLFLASCGNDRLTESSDNSDNNCFVFNKETQTILSYNFHKEVCGSHVVIPEKIDGVEVISIWFWAFVNYHLGSVESVLKNTMHWNDCSHESDCPELIEKEMQKFYKYYKTVESVEFPQSILWIDDKAFVWNAIKNITFPDSIHKIGKNVFNLTQIKEVSLPEIIEYVDSGDKYNSSFQQNTKINIVPFEWKLSQNKQAQKYRDKKRSDDLMSIASMLSNYEDDNNKYPNSLDELPLVSSKAIPKEKYLNEKTINGCTFVYKYTKISDDKYKLSTCLETEEEFTYESWKWGQFPFMFDTIFESY